MANRNVITCTVNNVKECLSWFLSKTESPKLWSSAPQTDRTSREQWGQLTPLASRSHCHAQLLHNGTGLVSCHRPHLVMTCSSVGTMPSQEVSKLFSALAETDSVQQSLLTAILFITRGPFSSHTTLVSEDSINTNAAPVPFLSSLHPFFPTVLRHLFSIPRFSNSPNPYLVRHKIAGSNRTELAGQGTLRQKTVLQSQR